MGDARCKRCGRWECLVFWFYKLMCLSGQAWVQFALQCFGIRRILVGPLIRYPSNIVETIDWRLSSRESFKSDQLRLIGIREGREVGERERERERDDPENRACEISLARLSPRLLLERREFKRHLFVVDSLDKQMQNEKELIHLASAGVEGLFYILYFCRDYYQLDLTCSSRFGTQPCSI